MGQNRKSLQPGPLQQWPDSAYTVSFTAESYRAHTGHLQEAWCLLVSARRVVAVALLQVGPGWGCSGLWLQHNSTGLSGLLPSKGGNSGYSVAPVSVQPLLVAVPWQSTCPEEVCQPHVGQELWVDPACGHLPCTEKSTKISLIAFNRTFAKWTVFYTGFTLVCPLESSSSCHISFHGLV